VRKPVLVGKGFGKHTFDEAVNMVEAGGVIVFDPGTYTNNNGYNIQNIRMRGDGKQPQDVQINSHFSVAENGKFEVENMQINFTANNNVINVQANGEFIASRTILNLDTTGDVPTVWNHGGSVTLLSSEVRRNNTDKYEALDGDGGHYLVKQSIADGIYVVNSYLKVETSQINGKIWLSNKAELEGTDVYFNGTVPTDDSSIKVFDGSKLTMESLILQADRTGVFVTHGFLTSQKSNIQPESKPVMIVGMDEQSEVNVPGAEVTVEAADGGDDQTNSYESAVPYDAETNDDVEPEPTEEPKPVVKAIDQLDDMIGLTKVKEAVHRLCGSLSIIRSAKNRACPVLVSLTIPFTWGILGLGKRRSHGWLPASCMMRGFFPMIVITKLRVRTWAPKLLGERQSRRRKSCKIL